jgi:hypothetical protein
VYELSYRARAANGNAGGNRVVVQFDCHPEQAFFARRRIWASRAMCRALRDTIIARLARFLIKLHRWRQRDIPV